jgi:uncharacterized membrane protein
MVTIPRDLLAAVLVGAASGGRSGTGLAAVTLAAPAHGRDQPDRILGRPAVQAVVCSAAALEYVGDKLPSAPSRLEPAGLGARVVAAAASGAIVGRRLTPSNGARIIACAGLAGSVAVAAAWLGTTWRRWGGEHLHSDFAAAVVEDCVVLGLAAAATPLAAGG